MLKHGFLALVLAMAWSAAVGQPQPKVVVKPHLQITVDAQSLSGLPKEDAQAVFVRTLEDAMKNVPKDQCPTFSFGLTGVSPPGLQLKDILPPRIDMVAKSDTSDPEDPPKIKGKECKAKTCTKKKCPANPATECVPVTCEWDCSNTKPMADGIKAPKVVGPGCFSVVR